MKIREIFKFAINDIIIKGIFKNFNRIFPQSSKVLKAENLGGLGAKQKVSF